tara:strand:- start:1935 stop:3245 length:1311 start_codon:yes stop_codon:yes gene_type:complete
MKNAPEKIVFTGSGLVCGSGSNVEDVWNALVSGQTSIGPYNWERGRVRAYDWNGENWPVKIASEVTEDNRTLVPDRKLHKTISRKDMLGIYASEKAIEDSGVLAHRDGLDEEVQDAYSDRTGLIVGSGGGNYQDNYDYLPLITEAKGELPGFGRELSNVVTPMWLLKNLPNNVLCHVGIRGQLKGTNACITNQCSSSVMAVAESASAIWNGEADRIVAAGHDAALEPEHILYYHKLGLMSSEVPKPFDANRSGTIFGEGAGAVVLEREGDAVARGAKVLGEFLGFGCCCEATGAMDLQPDGDGVTRAIEQALDDAELSPADVGMICAHGNGTTASDLTEGLGIHAVFGDDIPPVTGFKWAYGHLIGAAGIVDLVMTLEALKRGVVPGIPNLENVEDQIAPFPVQKEAALPRSDVALVICRGFGGMNVVLAVRGPST